MCGIVGYISKIDRAGYLPALVDRLAHRGPDGNGIHCFAYKDYYVGFGHTRLSILDLSEAAAQPFVSNNGEIVLSFNGEIYNYRNLKKSIGTPWKTTSDTELLCEGLALTGSGFIRELSGMFAFSAWDHRKQTLILARDKVGIKPLYYYFDGQTVAFASELKAIEALGLTLTISPQAVYNFLHLGYIPGPLSIYIEVKKVLPGEVLAFHPKDSEIKLQSRFYWKAEEEIAKNASCSIGDSQKTLKKLLYSAVEGHLISDVEVGSFLSGGIDSSLITAIAQNLSGKKIKSFSIGFRESEKNELPYARKVAAYLKTDHHEFILSEGDALERASKIHEIYDEPFADSSALPTLLVSEMTSKHTKVALSGDGGDELFLGYGMYQWARRLQNPMVQQLRPLVKPLAAIGKGSWQFQKLAMMLDYADKRSIKSHLFSQEQLLFSESDLRHLMCYPQGLSLGMTQSFSVDEFFTKEEQQAFFDFKYYLPDDLLVKVDRASMHHSLEVRVPLLDASVVSFALNLDKSLKLKNGQRKWLLRQVLFEHIPANYFDRPKAGFSIPLAKWLKTDLKYLVDTVLTKDKVEDAGIVQYAQVEKLIISFRAGNDYLYNKLWALIVLHRFFMSPSKANNLVPLTNRQGIFNS